MPVIINHLHYSISNTISGCVFAIIRVKETFSMEVARFALQKHVMTVGTNIFPVPHA
jgi:hypothetical protein